MNNSDVVKVGSDSVVVHLPSGIQYPRKLATGRIVYDRPQFIDSFIHSKVQNAFLELEAGSPIHYEE